MNFIGANGEDQPMRFEDELPEFNAEQRAILTGKAAPSGHFPQ